METYDLSKITSEDFKAYLEQHMNLSFETGLTVPATIHSVTDLNTHSPLERGAFSVVLQTKGDQAHRQQGIYNLQHPQLGMLELFLVPISVDQNGMNYEAVFA